MQISSNTRCQRKNKQDALNVIPYRISAKEDPFMGIALDLFTRHPNQYAGNKYRSMIDYKFLLMYATQTPGELIFL